ncbi:MAG TPA: helix-turn-helix transcriptional regulator [Microbacteriaceae bacterium]|jgi:transcriptional regulator with XRE-family HTH domain|nr:helix-turn-helix transcriptional regulator [Microbacteriaceae bacterium]
MAESTKEEYQAERSAYLEGFAENVRRLREERGWSQTDLYKAADLHRTEVGRMEGAESESRLLTLHILADTLGVKIDDLIAGLPVPKERRPPPSRKSGSAPLS